MTVHPNEAYLVAFKLNDKTLPEVDVFHLLPRLPFTAAPSVLLPRRHPARKTVQDIRAVADHLDTAGALER